MPVTLKQALQLEIMKNARFAAGESGCDRTIKRVSFIDSPMGHDVLEKGILLPGDFFVSSLFAVKDNLEGMLDIIRLLSCADSSGLCIIDEYLNDLPREALDLADQHDYPIVFVDRDIPYGDIIKDILMLISLDRVDKAFEEKIDGILQGGESEEHVESALMSINSHFKKRVLAINCKCNDFDSTKLVFLKGSINDVKEWTCQKFRDDILIIMTFGDVSENTTSAQTSYIINQLKLADPRIVVGVSNLRDRLGEAGRCIMEAIVASEASGIMNRSIIRYRELGSYRLLLRLRSKPEFREFHDEIILPILEFDRKDKKNLLETALCFVDNDGDFPKTAKVLLVHENSVRYRINKIMDIVGMRDRNLLFYEQLSIAVKIHRILTMMGKTA